MSELSSSSIYLVTLAEGDAETPGSFLWAFEQANAFKGEETPVIALDASLAGRVLTWEGYPWLTRDVRIENLCSDSLVELSGYFSLYSGKQVSVGSGIALDLGYSSIRGTLSMEPGSMLKGEVSIYDQGVLEMNGTRVCALINLSDMGEIRGEGNVFTLRRPFRVSYSYSAAPDFLVNCLPQLGSFSYEQDELYMPLAYTHKELILPALPAPYKGYELSYSSLSILSEGMVCFAEGAELYLQKSFFRAARMYGEGSVIFEGNNTIWFREAETACSPRDGALVLDCARAEFYGSHIHGTVEVGKDTVFVAQGVRFYEDKALVFNVADWDGSAPPSCLATVVDCQGTEGSYVSYKLEGLGGTTLLWEDAKLRHLLTPEGFEHAELESIILHSGDRLILPAGTRWVGQPIVVGEGAVLECGRSCRLLGEEVQTPYGFDYDLEPLCIGNGGTLVADDLHITGTLRLAPGARIEGSLHFEKGSRISLMDWSGSTQQLLDNVLANAQWTSAEPLTIEIGSYDPLLSFSNSGSFAAESELVDLGGRFAGYLAPEPGDIPGQTLTFSQGVDVDVEGSLNGYLAFAGDNVVRGVEGYDSYLSAWSVAAQDTRFEIPVVGVEDLTGRDITFAADIPLTFQLGDYSWVQDAIGWDGRAESLQTAYEAALQGIEGYRITAENPLLGVSVYLLEADLCLNTQTVQELLPEGEGYEGMYFHSLSISEGHSVIVEKGFCLNTGNVIVEEDSSLVIADGASIVDPLDDDPYIGVQSDATRCGRLEMTGVDLNNTRIYGQGHITLRGCKGRGELLLDSTYQTGSVTVTDCDLSQVLISIDEPVAEGVAPMVYDFSNNYWGTTNVEEVKARIEGYDERYVYLGQLLSSPPDGDSLAPAVKLSDPTFLKLGDGSTQVSVRWESNELATYELRVDGRTVYRGRDTDSSFILADGRHRLTLTATDAFGNSQTVSGNDFVLDATAPVLSLRPPTIAWDSHGQSEVTFSWKCNEEAFCVLIVDGVEHLAEDNTCTVSLEDGEHRYSVRAADVAGNVAEVEGSFGYVSDGAFFFLHEPELKPGKGGMTTVALKWEGEEGSYYSLFVDGVWVAGGKKTSWKGKLADGEHSYTLEATSMYGGYSSFSGVFSCDASAPSLLMHEVESEKISDGLSGVTLSWESHEEAVFSVMLGKQEVYRGRDSSCSLELADGRYNYTLTATDASGNRSTSKGSFTLDATAPRLRPGKVSVRKGKWGAPAAVTLSWKGESKATYSVYVDGELVGEEWQKKTSLKLSYVAEGEHDYKVVAKDTSGNEASCTGVFVVDTIAPVLNITAPEGFVNDAQACVSWQGVEGESYTLKLGRRTYSFSGAGQHSVSVAQGDGKYSYTLTAVDQGKNKTSVKGTFVVDTQSPHLSQVRLKGSKLVDGELQVTLSWKGESQASYNVRIGDEYFDSLTKASLTHRLSSGWHTYEITAIDRAGNTQSVSGELWVNTDGREAFVVRELEYSPVTVDLDRELGLSTGSLTLGETDGLAAITLPEPGQEKTSWSLLA